MTNRKWLHAAIALAILAVVGCGGDDDSGGGPADTPTPQATHTAMPTATEAATPAATPTVIDEHVEVEIGSSEEGGGQLAAEFDFSAVIPIAFNQCIGGTDEDCTGGRALFSEANPGFSGHHEHEEEVAAAIQGAAEEIFPLSETAEVSIEVVAIDAGLSLRFGEVTVDEASDTAVLGTGPEFHADSETLLLIDDRHSEEIYSLTFRLSADSGYTDSEEHTLMFRASEEEHDDDHEHEEGE